MWKTEVWFATRHHSFKLTSAKNSQEFENMPEIIEFE